MRNAFAEAVTEIADENQELIMLVGDIGNRLFNNFKEKHPRRFYNCGVAEAGMTGIAAGLASCGLQPITYTITPFNTLRCLEQIRLDVCYPDLPVIIVGTGSGLSYASLGATHHSMEDICILRSLPNMHVICPADIVEVKLALAEALRLKRPTYIRLGKKGEPGVHKKIPSFIIGKGITIQNGDEIALLGVGNMLSVAMDTAKLLKVKGLSVRVISMHTVKPLDEELLKELFTNYLTIAVIEEHGLAGGTGSAVLEWGSARRMDLLKLQCFGGPDKFLTSLGNQQQTRDEIGLNPLAISKKILEFMY
jgi:transketolase